MAEPLRLDLTVIAIPGFIAAMGLEYLWQRRHPAATGVSHAGDYDLADTLASLAMGVGSLAAPYVSKKLLDPVTPGRGRWGKVLLGTAAVAGVATTLGDVLRRYAAGDLPQPGIRPEVPRSADRVTGAMAVAAVGATALTVATTWTAQTSGARQFARHHRDLGGGPWAVALAILCGIGRETHSGVAAAGDEVPGREGGEGAQDREADSPVPERQSRMPPEQARPQWLVQRVRSEHRQPREARIGDQVARVGQRRSEAAVVAPDIER